jgi:squalene-hopene/tetraprenyl-beta-curcumene cyclase
MKKLASYLLPLALVAAVLPASAAEFEADPAEETQVSPYLSIKLESERAMRTGVSYLKSQQQPDGHWGDSEVPAITALALTAVLRDPDTTTGADAPEWIQKGFDFLRSSQKEDGGIYGKGLATYSTSTAIMAFVALDNDEDIPTILKARKFLVSKQADLGNTGESGDEKFDGGFGYGQGREYADLSNTYLALEALYHTKTLAADSKQGEQPKLDWEAALKFVSRCQNLPATNDRPWASDDAENKGGFVYHPAESKAGEQELADGTVALRSYGSMTYAGLLSFIYADLDKDDQRVAAALDWLGKNYNMTENPGMGLQGLYYYYQTIAKALSAAGVDKLTLADGSKADWRADLTEKLLTSQREDGSWVNSNSRWWENDPVLVTSYTVLSLAQLHSVM